ncbi:MAG: hypothetical protein GXO89_15740 [Chlorobi bacterium]|nr:hypothetical protein [Chlorobiota bacterium]
MKKATILITFITFSICVNAQSEKISGSWLMTKVEKGGEPQEIYNPTDFAEDGNVMIFGMPFGTWKYQKKGNLIEMKSEMEKEFNGDWAIDKLDKDEMILSSAGTKLYYLRLYPEKIKEANRTSGLIGTWNYADEEYETNLLKFEAPNTFVLKSISGMETSTSQGEWMFDPSDNSLLITGFAYNIRGKNKIVKLNDKELEFTHEGLSIKATKENPSGIKIERLTFVYEDFPEEFDPYEIIPAKWQDLGELVSYLSTVEYLEYSYGTLIEDFGIFSYKPVLKKVEANSEKNEVMFTFLSIFQGDTMQNGQKYKDHLSESYNFFFPWEEPSVYRSLGTETITVPAGTFECTLIEGIDGEDKVKFWMINDKPGVYARTIRETEVPFGELEYNLIELEGIK